MTSNIETTPEPQDDAALVLIVDDDPAIRFLVRENLEPHEFRVEEAANGLSALDMFAELQPDIVLLDIMMPGMNGFDVCKTLRGMSEGQNTPILVLTALEDMESIDRAYGLGATDFATKPLNWSILPHRVRYLVRVNRAMELALVNEARLEEAQRLAHIGNWEWDVRENRLIWSDEVFRIFGVQPLEFDANVEAFMSFVHEDDRVMVDDAVKRALTEHEPYMLDHRIRRPDGVVRFVQERAELLFDGNSQPLRMIGTVQDITERRQAEDRVRHLAYYDDLTGLPNRVFFEDQLARAIAVAGREKQSVVVILLDLDHFRRINDTLGHKAGDRLLQLVAYQLKECLRDSDYVARILNDDNGPLARLGGDEFALLLPSVDDPHRISQLADRINECLAEPFSVAEREIVVSASLGIAVYPRDGLDAGTLVKNADTAMYQAKESGRSEFRFFSPQMQDTAMERLAMEAELRRAMQLGEFVLHYQPQLDLLSDRLVAVEALVRWNSPDRGLVPPGDFIPIAEQFGLISSIGAWVLEEACRQNRVWQEAGYHELSVAVNLSGLQFRDSGFPDEVGEALISCGLESKWLELELTETTIMRMVDATFDTLESFKQRGVALAVDDFGTGYSSLSYLTRFPIDTLKIDRSFVEGIGKDHDNTAVVRGVVSMAHGLGLKVVAEGVETEEQLQYLKEIGCDRVQGFYISHPLPADRLAALLTKND